jgi:transposase-like protein
MALRARLLFFLPFKKRVVERALAGELTHHLGYAKGEAPEEEVDNPSQRLQQENGKEKRERWRSKFHGIGAEASNLS